MLNKVTTILEYSRILSLPVTFVCWMVIFMYSALVAGHIWYGILGLICVSAMHLAINILSNYFDYKDLTQNDEFDREEYLRIKDNKHRFLVSGFVKSGDLLWMAFAHIFVALAIGVFFYLKCSKVVLNIALIGFILSLLTIFSSKIRYSELLPSLSYGPLLFCSTYLVMTKTFNTDAILLSIPYLFLSATVLYMRSIKNYDNDLSENHITIANSFDSQLDSLVILKWLIVATYVSPILLCLFDILDWQILAVWATIPAAINLYKSMIECTSEKEADCEPEIYQARKIAIFYSLISVVAIILALN